MDTIPAIASLNYAIKTNYGVSLETNDAQICHTQRWWRPNGAGGQHHDIRVGSPSLVLPDRRMRSLARDSAIESPAAAINAPELYRCTGRHINARGLAADATQQHERRYASVHGLRSHRVDLVGRVGRTGRVGLLGRAPPPDEESSYVLTPTPSPLPMPASPPATAPAPSPAAFFHPAYAS